MSEAETHEHDEDEPVGAPVSGEPAADEDEHDDEADAAERGASDPDDDAEGEGDDAPQPGTHADAKAQRDQQKLIEKMFDQFDREAKRHSDRVSEIGGESAQDLLPCVMCMPDEGQPRIPGFLLPVPPSEEKIAAIRQALGLAPKIDYRADPYAKACDTCGGLGSTRSGAQVQGQDLLPCHDCGSKGWVATGEQRGGSTPNGARPDGLTGPTVRPLAGEPDPPEVASLKQRGYTVIAPMAPAVGV